MDLLEHIDKKKFFTENSCVFYHDERFTDLRGIRTPFQAQGLAYKRPYAYVKNDIFWDIILLK